MSDFKQSREKLAERVNRAFNAPFNSYLTNLIKPSIRLVPSEIRIATALSQIGGIPHLPDNQWPKSTKTGTYLSFLAQIDLERYHRFDLEQALPAHGVLAFYIDLYRFPEGKVMYYPNKEKLRMAKVPEIFRKEKERKSLPIWKRIFTKEEPVKIFKYYQIYAYSEYHIPSWDSLQMKLFHLQNGTRPKDLTVNEGFIDDYCGPFNSDHHLLGYYVAQQSADYELGGFESTWRVPKRTEASIRKGLEWRLLFQLDSDRLTGMNWMDAGQLLFFIRNEDLQRQDFNHVKVVVDST